MNAEIYFPRNGKAFGQTSERSFETTIKKLTSVNVNIIYKTEINLTEESISEALRVSDSGDEKIGMIFVADALTEDDPQKVKDFFESIGILGKVKRLESDWHDPLDENEPGSHDGSSRKKKKKKNKFDDYDEFDEEPEEEETAAEEDDMIDISKSLVSIEPKPFYAYCAEYSSKLIVLLPEHETLDTNFISVLYTAALKAVTPKKKRSFWKRMIPCKGDGPLDVIRKIVLILALATFIVSSYMLINILVIEPAVNDRTTSSIRDLLVSTDENQSSDTKKSTDGSEGVLSDFSKLLEANPDTVGWITVPNTVIDYVVVQSPEDAQNAAEDKDPHYLYKDFYNNYSKYGTVFLDYRSPLDSKNLLLHGHHMQDGRMFSNIMYYANDLEFYKKSPVFTFNTLYEKSKWKIIAVVKTNTLIWQGPVFNYLRGNFSSDYDFLNFVYELRMRSIINCPVDVNENDTLVTLSTCAYDFDDFRCIVVARKVRDGEGTEVDVSKAELNPSPLYPDIWYDTYGGVKPVVTSFQDAYNKGEITWYDGQGKWS
ncbi:MAG: class B sortase, partial [Clostridia bacterium]|nr:class B sortase [Clostridia bacterium]